MNIKFRSIQLNMPQKWIILVVYPQSRQTLGTRPQTPFRFNESRMCKDPTPIEHFWLMQILGNLGANRNVIILYFLPPPWRKIASALLSGWYLLTLQTNSAFFKTKLEHCSHHTCFYF